MNRSWWISGWWEKPKFEYCDLGHPLFKDGFCHQRHSVEPFEIRANPTVRWNEVNIMRYNILDRARERMSMTIALQEEASIQRLIRAEEEVRETEQEVLDILDENQRD